mmetsp:Transcript_5535/g.6429  ORF Transcript_5535/g.6429 Transcript_5535/m.6429 type:complete len:94 (-) Transcript_5535:202-483(-)
MSEMHMATATKAVMVRDGFVLATKAVEVVATKAVMVGDGIVSHMVTEAVFEWFWGISQKCLHTFILPPFCSSPEPETKLRPSGPKATEYTSSP